MMTQLLGLLTQELYNFIIIIIIIQSLAVECQPFLMMWKGRKRRMMQSFLSFSPLFSITLFFQLWIVALLNQSN
jgi:hypothetical protein